MLTTGRVPENGHLTETSRSHGPTHRRRAIPIQAQDAGALAGSVGSRRGLRHHQADTEGSRKLAVCDSGTVCGQWTLRHTRVRGPDRRCSGKPVVTTVSPPQRQSPSPQPPLDSVGASCTGRPGCGPLKTPHPPSPGSSVGQSVIPACQGCGFDIWSGYNKQPECA